jgi:hypothetical protein
VSVKELLDYQESLRVQRQASVEQSEANRTVLNPAPEQKASDFVGTVRTNANRGVKQTVSVPRKR